MEYEGREASIPLLAVLSPKDRQRSSRARKARTFAKDEVLVREGDPPLHLYIVAAGHARIERADQGLVARLGPGDFFGELALIEEHDRTATVVAEDELTCSSSRPGSSGRFSRSTPRCPADAPGTDRPHPPPRTPPTLIVRCVTVIRAAAGCERSSQARYAGGAEGGGVWRTTRSCGRSGASIR